MNLIRLFYNNLDVKVSATVQHFLHYLGFYVEKIEDEKSVSNVNSVADIYIISNAFFEENSELLELMNLNKTVTVLLDGWETEDETWRSIVFDEKVKDVDFLQNLVDNLCNIIQENEMMHSGFFKNISQWQNLCEFVTERYVKNKLLKSSLFTRCFYKQNEFYDWGIRNYKSFIQQLEEKQIDCKGQGEDAEYLKYVLILAKYEANLIAKINVDRYSYNSNDLVVECIELLKKYKNEQLLFLKADILYELNENWQDGYDHYKLAELAHCSYAYFKCGKILRLSFKNYREALVVLKNAVFKNSKYFQAWYQMGDCYECLGNYDKAIECFRRICKILNRKYEKKLLAPLEMEYYYKALLRIAFIYKARIGNYSNAFLFSEMAEHMKKQNVIQNYIYIMLENEEPFENVVNKINEAVEQHVAIKLEEIY